MKEYNSKRYNPGEYFPMPKATAYGKEATSQDSQTANEKSSMSMQRQENKCEEKLAKMIAEKKAKKRALRNTSHSQNGRGATFAEGRNKITPLRSVIPSVCELATSTSSFGQKYSRL